MQVYKSYIYYRYLAQMTKRFIVKDCQKQENNLLIKERKFDLLRYFTLSSIAIILTLTAILSFVFVVRQKDVMIDQSVQLIEEATQQLNHNVTANFTAFDFKKSEMIDKGKIKYDQLDKIIKDFLKTHTDLLKVKV